MFLLIFQCQVLLQGTTSLIAVCLKTSQVSCVLLPVIHVDETMYAIVHAASMQLSAHDLTTITEYVKPHSHKWKEIGPGLGFTADEISNFEARPTLAIGAPFSYLSAMLSDWRHWAPGDARGSTNYATLDSLKTALDKSGLGLEAQELCL